MTERIIEIDNIPQMETGAPLPEIKNTYVAIQNFQVGIQVPLLITLDLENIAQY